VVELESEILDKMHKRIVQNFLDVVILMELRTRPLSNRDVVSFVHNKFGILLSLDTASSCLHGLEKEGLIKGEWVQRKRVYTSTELGKETATMFLNTKNKILGLILNLFVGG